MTSSEPKSGSPEFWEPAIETMSRSEMDSLQSEGLQRQLQHVASKSRFFGELFDAANVSVGSIGGIEDLRQLPIFRKEDLRSYRARTGDPFAGTLCVPMGELRHVTHSSGTSGKPNHFGFTEEELVRVGNVHARASFTSGIRPGDHLVFAGPNWRASRLAWHVALEQMRIVSIYIGQDSSDVLRAALEMATDFTSVTGIWTMVPEEDLEILHNQQVDLKTLFPQLRLTWSAIDCSAPRRQLLSDAFGVPFCNHYGSGDQYFMFGECPLRPGTFHVAEDAYIVEILDFDTGEPVAAGEAGLLHLTNLVGTANPFIRYNMEDAVVPEAEDCGCGRTSLRLRPMGRMSWVVHTTVGRVFHIQLEEMIWADSRVAGRYYQILREQRQPQERLHVRVAAEDGDSQAAIEHDLSEKIGADLGLPVKVELVPMEGIRFASYGKFPRVIDVAG